MNKNYLLLAVVIIGAGVLYKRSMQSMVGENISAQAESAAADTVTLISNDGQKFSLPIAVAEQSQLIRNFLNGPFEEAQTKEFPFKRISGASLKQVVSLLKGMKTAMNIDNYVIKQFVTSYGTCDIDQLLDVAQASNFLEIEQLTHSLMRLYVFISLRANSDATLELVKFSVESPTLQSIIVTEYPVIQSSAGFKALGAPLREAVHFGASNLKSLFTRADILDLREESITNLYGLLLIENRQAIRTLWLTDNKITSVQPGAFEGFGNLQTLDLSNNARVGRGNHVTVLPKGAFIGLDGLLTLNIQDVGLAFLSEGAFMGLEKLTALFIFRNPLGMTEDQIKQNYFSADSPLSVVF